MNAVKARRVRCSRICQCHRVAIADHAGIDWRPRSIGQRGFEFENMSQRVDGGKGNARNGHRNAVQETFYRRKSLEDSPGKKTACTYYQKMGYLI